MGVQDGPDPQATPPDDDDDFPWDAPIHVVRSTPQNDLPAEWAQDRTLSLGARGLLAEIMAHGGEWDIDAEGLAELRPTEDVDAIRGYIAELERAGYLDPSGD